MKKILVLGIGNRMMEDDGIGVHVVEAIAKTNNSYDIRYVAGETDVDYCLRELAWGDRCIFIDGSISEKEPCSVETYPLLDVYAQNRPLLSFHDFDLIHAMKKDNILKDGILIAIEIYSLGFSTELSQPLSERFSEIVQRVKEIIDNYKSCVISLS